MNQYLSSWIAFLLFLSCATQGFCQLQGKDPHLVLRDEIQESLSSIPHKISSQDLFSYFQKLEKTTQLLYCQIRNNQIYWTKSKLRNDENRNRVIFHFFLRLIEKYPLPDLDFILCTEDGFHENAQLPLFAFAADRLKRSNVMLFPDFEALDDSDRLIAMCSEYAEQYLWNNKLEKVFFRGASTGKFKPHDIFYGNERVKAVAFSAFYPEILEADFTAIKQKPIEYLMKQLKKPIVPLLPIRDHFAYKYLLDIDGYSTTYSRCRWILLSNSVLLKVSSDLIQWYYKALVPYQNYIPIKDDLSDLKEAFEWLKIHDIEAYKIANEGRKLGLQLFSTEMIETYVYQLLSSYSEKISVN